MEFQRDREEYLLKFIGRKLNNFAEGSMYLYTDKGLLSEWEYFGLLITWAQNQPFWGHFKLDVIGEDSGLYGPLHFPISEYYINPDTFIPALYTYITAGESEDSIDRGETRSEGLSAG